MCKSKKCKKCGAQAILSKGYGNAYISHNDFGNDAGNRGTTQTKVTGKVVDCLKCSGCGHSWVPENIDELLTEKK